jgi:hypothetical protein
MEAMTMEDWKEKDRAAEEEKAVYEHRRQE